VDAVKSSQDNSSHTCEYIGFISVQGTGSRRGLDKLAGEGVLGRDMPVVNDFDS
jgi:hypothetical protein